MATDIVAQLADSLAKTGVEDGELSYKGQGRKLDNAQSGEYHLRRGYKYYFLFLMCLHF